MQWTSGGRDAASKPCRARRRDTSQGDNDDMQNMHNLYCICSSCYFCDTILLSFASAVAAANPGLLKALNQMDTDEERLLFVSQLHKVHIRTYVVS